MSRLCLTVCLLVIPITLVAQPDARLEKKLNSFWKSRKAKAKIIAETSGFSAGDTIADIGTADGWFAAAVSAFTDSLTFYLEDIDSSAWDQEGFLQAVRYFSAMNNASPSHQYRYVRGTEKKTGLAPNKYNKVLIVDTYHHFTHRYEMLSDARSLLTYGGKILIFEVLARKPGDIHHGCGSRIFSEEEIVADLRSLGMKLERTRFVDRVAGRQTKLFIFGRVEDN